MNVGDRVIAIKNAHDKVTTKSVLGLTGTIIKHNGGSFLVEFDTEIDGHSGDNDDGKDGHCWWVDEDILKLIEPEESLDDIELGSWGTKL